MNATSTIPEDGTVIPSELRERLVDNHLVPLWESPTAHKTDVKRELAHVWAWESTGPVIKDISKISSPKVVERRVLSLVNPIASTPEDEATTGVISATLQMLLPGERARPHRHSMSALRFVLEGSGAETIVDGKSCPMEPGDLIITPAWTWHEHVGGGDEATIWVDVLDVALHLAIGTEAFQPGPITDAPQQTPEEAFAVANMVPRETAPTHDYSPVFRYSRGNAERALAAAPARADGSRSVRYVNPLTGGPVMPMLDCSMLQLAGSSASPADPSNGSRLCVVTHGHGASEIGGETVKWSRNDVFTIPRGAKAVHHAESETARIFTVDNGAIYERLGVVRVP